MARSKHPKPKGLLKDLPINLIIRLPALQFREKGTDPDHVEALSEVISDRSAKKPPRVQIRLVEGKGHLLTDGFHTVEAYERAGRKTVPANVLKGTWHDALADALKANVQHDLSGKRRTNADKRAVAEAALENFPGWSNARIAEHCRVSPTLVANLRKSLEIQGDGETPTPNVWGSEGQAEVRTGRDGKPREVPRKQEAAWRAKPLTEFLDVADHVWAALKLSKLETAGELFKALAKGATLGMSENTRRDLLECLKELDGFDGRLQEGAEGGGPKAGSEQFNWRHHDGPFGAVVRSVNAVADHYPGFQDSTEYQGLQRLLSEFRSLWEAAQKRLTKKAA